MTSCLRVASSILQKAWPCSGLIEPHTTMSSAIRTHYIRDVFVYLVKFALEDVLGELDTEG